MTIEVRCSSIFWEALQASRVVLEAAETIVSTADIELVIDDSVDGYQIRYADGSTVARGDEAIASLEETLARMLEDEPPAAPEPKVLDRQFVKRSRR